MLGDIFQNIVGAITTTAIVVASLFTGGNAVPEGVIQGASEQIPTTVAVFETSLQNSISSTDTSMTLVSAAYNGGASTLASSTYAFVIDSGTVNEEFVIADCTGTTCTNMTRGLDHLTGTTTVTSLKKAHRRGASVKITDGPVLLIHNRLLQGVDDFEKVLSYTSGLTFTAGTNEIPDVSYVDTTANTASTSATAVLRSANNTFTGTNTFSATTTFSAGAEWSQQCSDNEDLCNKAYVDSVAVAGASDAGQTTKGIVEEATVAEINSESSVGSTGAKLFMTPESFGQSNFASTTATVATSTSSVNVTSTVDEVVFIVAKGIIATSGQNVGTASLQLDGVTVDSVSANANQAGGSSQYPFALTWSWSDVATTTTITVTGASSAFINVIKF